MPNRAKQGRGWLLLLVALSGCGSASAPSAALTSGPVLAPAAVPGLPSVTRPVTSRLLSRDANLPELPDELARTAFQGGRERTYQGYSRRLTLVVSRSLQFREPSGAATHLAFLRAHATRMFGAFVTVRPLRAAAGRGWLFTPSPCACHLANPDYTGVVQDGRRLSWLEVNGPAATPSVLVALLDPARTTLA